LQRAQQMVERFIRSSPPFASASSMSASWSDHRTRASTGRLICPRRSLCLVRGIVTEGGAPGQFRRVISLQGSFVQIPGGNPYPRLISTTSQQPLRISIGAESRDLHWNERDMNFFSSNLRVAAAFAEEGYDVRLVVSILVPPSNRRSRARALVGGVSQIERVLISESQCRAASSTLASVGSLEPGRSDDGTRTALLGPPAPAS
jgi:hypothetical protein